MPHISIRFFLICAGLLVIMMPCNARCETRVIRFSGDCDLTEHDSFQNGIEVQTDGRMHYSTSISCQPFVGSEWIISPTISVTNNTDAAMHCRYYIAFFDQDDRLVGCCNQGSQIAEDADNLQFGSCIIHGPKSRLLEAARYDAVIYESDEPIGVEGTAKSNVAETLAAAETIVTKLSNIEKATYEKQQPASSEDKSYTMILATADIEFLPKVDRERNTHLKLADDLYDLYLSTAYRETLVMSTSRGEKNETRYKAWRINTEFERKVRDRTIKYRYHIALLDADGRLVICTTYFGGLNLYAPSNLLLNAEKLSVVVYEEPETEQE